jgi:hypothetical protein
VTAATDSNPRGPWSSDTHTYIRQMSFEQLLMRAAALLTLTTDQKVGGSNLFGRATATLALTSTNGQGARSVNGLIVDLCHSPGHEP